MTSGTQWRYDKFTWPEMREVIARSPQPVVAIPFGTVEDHGPHLPLSTDNDILESVLWECGRRAGGDILVTPTIPVGLDNHHMDFPGTLSVDMEICLAYVSQVAISVARHGFTRVGPAESVTWPTLPGGLLPEREGPRPAVSWTIPQQQESDNSPDDLQEALFARMSSLPGVESGPSRISVPGARAVLAPDATGPEEAFLVPSAREFAHLHPAHDGSLHLVLPVDLAADAVAKGWAQVHMLAGIRLSPGFVLVYGPRTEAELDVVAGIVEASHRFALGG